MRQVRLPGAAELSLMRLRREVVRPADQFHLGVGVITPDLLDQLFNADGRGQHATTSSERLDRKSLSRSWTPSVPFQVLISRLQARSTRSARGNARNAPMPYPKAVNAGPRVPRSISFKWLLPTTRTERIRSRRSTNIGSGLPMPNGPSRSTSRTTA